MFLGMVTELYEHWVSCVSGWLSNLCSCAAMAVSKIIYVYDYAIRSLGFSLIAGKMLIDLYSAQVLDQLVFATSLCH